MSIDDKRKDHHLFPGRRKGDQVKGVASVVGAASGLGGLGAAIYIIGLLAGFEGEIDFRFDSTPPQVECRCDCGGDEEE